MRRRKPLIVVAIAVIVVASLWGGWAWLQRLDERIRTAYALDETGAILITFMEENNNHMPSGWQELETFCEPDEFSYIKERVEIDWSIDTSQTQPPNAPPRKFILLRSGVHSARTSPANDWVETHLAKKK